MLIASGAAALLSSCAGAPPPAELMRARAAYERARTGPAGRLAQADLHGARLALLRAEAAYDDDGDEPRTRDLAYLAERRSEITQARGRTMAATRDGRVARAQIESIEDAQHRQADASLVVARQQVGTERAARTRTQAELARERTARAAAEGRAAAALESLRQLGLVRMDADRIIITLSGSVLFATGESALLPIARQRLTDVARSLLDRGFGRITVGGHTDSRGGSGQNQSLSLARAQAVRDYLVSQGLPGDRVDAVGFGESHPVTANATAEGRANNRRVELVVQPEVGPVVMR